MLEAIEWPFDLWKNKQIFIPFNLSIYNKK